MTATTSTLTGQQQAAAVLARILATTGLADATWTVYRARLCASAPEIVGQLADHSIPDARSAVDAYALAFGLSLENEKYLPGDDRCAGFTKIEANGVVDGVRVKVWCPGRQATR